MNLQKPYFDVLILVPLQEELVEVSKVFVPVKSVDFGSSFLVEAQPTLSGLTIAVARQNDMGSSSARTILDDILRSFDIGCVFCLGIAGGISNDVKLCDVVVALQVYDMIDNMKFGDDKNGAMKVEFDPRSGPGFKSLIIAMQSMPIRPESRFEYEFWLECVKEEAHKILPDAVAGRNHKPEKIGKPKVHFGSIASGSVSKSATYNSQLAKASRKMLAIETESGGVAIACEQNNVDWVTIRSISDYADASKGDLEETTSGAVRQLAIFNAATFLKLNLDHNVQAITVIRCKRNKRQEEENSAHSSLIEESFKQLTAVLNDLYPMTKGLSSESRYPYPRIRSTSNYQQGVGENPSEIVEFNQAIRSQKVLRITVPRNYPDRMLAWGIAYSIFGYGFDEKVVVSKVISPSELKLGDPLVNPEYTQLVTGLSVSTIQPVCIVDVCDLNDKRIRKNLIHSINSNVDWRFIILVGAEYAAVDPLIDVVSTSRVYKLDRISFAELKRFVSSNYGFDGAKSEVIALRLAETFEKWGFDGLPNYMAAMHRDVITKLVEANRRSELIQLAVDGVLSLVVADDRSTKVSRTTRRKFLQQLAKSIRVDKTPVSYINLLTTARSLSDNMDYGLEPRKFIQSFIEAQIINFKEDACYFVDYFVESYLVASYLQENEDDAIDYFDFNAKSFDYDCFDIYAELTPHTSVVSRAKDRIDSLLMSDLVGKQDDVLIRGSVASKSMRKPQLIASVAKQIEIASKDIASGTDQTKSKQHILDLAESARRVSIILVCENMEVYTPDQLQHHREMYSIWKAVTILIGSGSENISGETKKVLIASLLNASSYIIKLNTDFVSRINFSLARPQIMDFVSKDIGSDHDDLIPNKGYFVDAVLGMLESSVLTFPLQHIISELCDFARSEVIANTVSKVVVKDKLSELIRSYWLFDINGPEGRRSLSKAFDSVGNAVFIRKALCDLMIARVFWFHHDKEHRLSMIKSAQETLSVIGTDLSTQSIAYEAGINS